MAERKTSRFWLMTMLFLVAIIMAGIALIWMRRSPGQPIEVRVEQRREFSGNIYIGGDIADPGLYPFTSADSIASLLQAAGATPDNIDRGKLELYVSNAGGEGPQKVNINRAEAWLLEALPGIGITLAQRIVDYREQNGPFRNIDELLKVSGLGDSVLEKIRDKISVVD